MTSITLRPSPVVSSPPATPRSWPTPAPAPLPDTFEIPAVAASATHSVPVDQQIVDDVYAQNLGRAPDASGLKTWSGVARWLLASGATRQATEAFIAEKVRSSPEWRQRMISAVYHQELGRAPDAGGAQSYLTLSNNLGAFGKSSGQIEAAVRESIRGSHEWRGHQVAGLYHALLNRAPDAGGLRSNTALADAYAKLGIPPEKVRDFVSDVMQNSHEFKTKHPGAKIPAEPPSPAQIAAFYQALAAHPAMPSTWQQYADLVRSHGGQVCPNGEPTVIGIRHGISGASTSYNESFVVLTPDGRVRSFPGATHPGQTRSSASPDVNHDGAGDVGMIAPGNYKVVPNGPHGGNASFRVETVGGSGWIPGWRDTNHDGVYSDAERAASQARGDSLSGILFHQGNAYSPSSIGCQTMSPGAYQQFLSAVGGPNASFNYSLVQL
jgi:hypothetical protein